MVKIYRIVDNTNGNIYIGKTKQKYLSSRLAKHKYTTKKNTNRCMSREIIKNGDYKIELIEETEDKTRERYWIENTECINKALPGRTTKEWCIDNKEKIKKQKQIKHQKNRDRNLKRMKLRAEIIKPYEISWGGRKDYQNNCLLKIDPNLFLHSNF
tara:strand:- start:57 stop:524 length:468 start_codon:yes stop_codon:yes gene_type:complete